MIMLVGTVTIRQRIRAARVQRRLTQAQCAAYAKVSQGAWSAWELPRGNIGFEALSVIAKCLGVSAAWLRDGDRPGVEPLLDSLTAARAPEDFMLSTEHAALLEQEREARVRQQAEDLAAARAAWLAQVAAREALAVACAALAARRRQALTSGVFPCRLCDRHSRLYWGMCQHCFPLTNPEADFERLA